MQKNWEKAIAALKKLSPMIPIMKTHGLTLQIATGYKSL
jgi:hypothetical protein